MPTQNPRHTITEDEAVRAALDAAAERWPDLRDRPSKLIRCLVIDWHRRVRDSDKERERAVVAASGVLTGMYPPGYLQELRDEWPE